MVDNATLQDLDIMTLNCSQGFFVNSKTGRCSPTCDVLEELSYNNTMLARNFRLARAIIGVFHSLGGFLALAMAVYNYKIM